jgi:hypothetical protein
MLVKNCKACDHYLDSGHNIGTCRRYPTFQSRSPNERCGEFTPVPYADAVPDMLALPVREMTEDKPKRKGRPPKASVELKGIVV